MSRSQRLRRGLWTARSWAIYCQWREWLFLWKWWQWEWEDEKWLRLCELTIQVHVWKNVARSTTSTLMQYDFLFRQNQWWVENLNWRYNNDDKHDDGYCSHMNHNDEKHHWCEAPFPRLFYKHQVEKTHLKKSTVINYGRSAVSSL